MYEGQTSFLNWLADDTAMPVVLLEFQIKDGNGAAVTLRMSTKHHYATKPTDTPANEPFPAIANVTVLYTEQLSVSPAGEASLSAGQINVQNPNGERDAWMDYIWTNGVVIAYLGDLRWPFSSFQQFFKGTVADITQKDDTVLTVSLRDKMQLLNTNITEVKIGGAGQNKDKPVPVMLGEVFNASPPLKNESTLTYKYGAKSCAGLVEVRDGGIPITVTEDKANGEFTLSKQPFGDITVSAQGDNVGGYTNTIGALIRKLITQYGNATAPLTDADIDLTNFTNFDTAHPDPVGIYATEQINIIDACRQLAGSVGAQLFPSRLGLFRLTQLLAPSGSPVMDVTTSDIYDGTFVPTGTTDPIWAVKLGYCKNWTPQSNLTPKIPAAHRDIYSQEWPLNATATDTVVKGLRKLSGEPELQESLLIKGTNATAESTRRRDLWKVPRRTYEFVAKRRLLQLELGNVIRVWHPRYGMSAGKLATVVMLQPDWESGKVKVGIMV